MLTVIPAHPFPSPEGDYVTERLQGFSEGEAWLLVPNGMDSKPLSHGFEVFWSRDNGDVWLFRSYGLTTEELVDLVRLAQPGEGRRVGLADASMHLVASNIGAPGTIRQQQYVVDGAPVSLTVRNDGGVFDLIVSASEIRTVSVVGLTGYTATLGNGQVEFVWDAGDGWWAAASVAPALAPRADEIRDAIETAPRPCPSEPPFAATTLPDGFSPELLLGSGGQITIGPDGAAVPIEPVDPAVHHYAAEPGRFIDIHNQSMPGYRPATVEPIEVLGTNGLFGGIEDGFTVEFSLPCGTYTMNAYGISSDAFKDVITGLVTND
jgi:hypothetical protein